MSFDSIFENTLSLSVVVAICALIGPWAAWKARRSSGKDVVNDFLTDVGEGSFIGSFVHKFMSLFWGAIAGICFLTAMFSLAQCSSINEKTQSTAKPPLDEKIQIAPPKEPLVKPAKNSGIDQPAQNTSPSISPTIETKSANETKTNTLEKAETTSSIAINKDAAKKIFSEEEIQQLEKEKGYSGNDPVIRARLGLPPKE